GCAIRARRVFGDRLHHGLSPLLLLHACTPTVRSRHKKNGRLNVAHPPWISEETSRPLTAISSKRLAPARAQGDGACVRIAEDGEPAGKPPFRGLAINA